MGREKRERRGGRSWVIARVAEGDKGLEPGPPPQRSLDWPQRVLGVQADFPVLCSGLILLLDCSDGWECGEVRMNSVQSVKRLNEGK